MNLSDLTTTTEAYDLPPRNLGEPITVPANGELGSLHGWRPLVALRISQATTAANPAVLLEGIGGDQRPLAGGLWFEAEAMDALCRAWLAARFPQE